MKRNSTVDLISGCLIVYMILMHLNSFASVGSLPVMGEFFAKLWKVAGFFCGGFMPWFFYKSGFFHKNASLQETFRKSSRSLLVPLLVFSVIGQLGAWLHLVIKHDYSLDAWLLHPMKRFLLDGAVYANSPLWFLTTLFFVKLLASVTIKDNRSWVAMLLGFLMAGGAYKMKIEEPLWIANTGLGLFCYAMGAFAQRSFLPSFLPSFLSENPFVAPSSCCLVLLSWKCGYEN